MHIPAKLDLDIGARGVIQIHRHDGRAATVERERRLQHPRMTDGNQRRVAHTGLLTQDLDRCCATVLGVELRVLRQRHRFAQGSAGGQTLGKRGSFPEK